MKNHTSPEGRGTGEGPADEILLIAERHFRRMLERIDLIIVELKESETVAAKEAQAAVRDLSKAVQTIFDERTKFEKLRNLKAGAVHHVAFDFDAARDEIGRRMARLRAARGAGGIPQ